MSSMRTSIGPLPPLVIGRPILKTFFVPTRHCIGESSVRLVFLHAETILPIERMLFRRVVAIERMRSIIETFFVPTRHCIGRRSVRVGS